MPGTAFQKLGRMLTRHLDGIVNDSHEKVSFGKVEAIIDLCHPGFPCGRVISPMSCAGETQRTVRSPYRLVVGRSTSDATT